MVIQCLSKGEGIIDNKIQPLIKLSFMTVFFKQRKTFQENNNMERESRWLKHKG